MQRDRFASGGLDHQMIMIWHQTIGGHVDNKKISRLLEQIDKLLVIRFLNKYICSPAPTIHHMVPGIRIIYSQWSRHGRYISIPTTKVKSRLDPNFFPKQKFYLEKRTVRPIYAVPDGSRCRVETIIF